MALTQGLSTFGHWRIVPSPDLNWPYISRHYRQGELGLVQRRLSTALTLFGDIAFLNRLGLHESLAMPPAPHEYHGAEAIAAFLGASAVWRAGRRLRLRPTRANGQPGFVCEFADETAQPAGMIVLTLAGDRIHGITRFLDNRVAAYFDAAAFGPTEAVSSPRARSHGVRGRR